MRLLGIDPGLATIGLGLIEAESPHKMQAVEWLTITTRASQDLPERLREIEQDLTEYTEQAKPECVVVEKLFFATNKQTAIDVAQARGVILSVLQARNIPIIEPTPLELKSAITGDGKADKRQMQDMLVSMLKLSEIPRPDDAADALALAVYGAVHRQVPALP